jgi:pimeloyl-ACP methyl ester carboxylesterase
MPLPDHVQLPDGRNIELRITGPDDGLPLLYHHGTPGAAAPFRALERAAHERNLRVVTISRPGYGASTRQRGRTIGDVVADISVVIDAIGAERCLVAGWSGGGPHALACAARLDAVAAALVIAGVVPYPAQGLDWLAGMGEDNVAEFNAAFAGEDALRAFLDPQREDLMSATSASVLSSLGNLLAAVDQAVLTEEVAEDMVSQWHQALRPGVDGWLDDDLAFISPWGFDLKEVSVPTFIWQGSEDLMVPFGYGQWLSEHLPAATTHLEHGEGHMSIALGSLDRMLDELVAVARSS